MTSSSALQSCPFHDRLCQDVAVEASETSDLFFAYPSAPESRAEALERTVQLINEDSTIDITAIDWRDLPIEGKIVFCQICWTIRHTACVVVDLTELNFNVLFELGFSIGAGKPIYPLVEQGLSQRTREYRQFQTLTSIGYASYSNSSSLFKKIVKKRPWARKAHFEVPPQLKSQPSREAQKILYLKSVRDNEPSLRITELLDTLSFEVVIDDPSEVNFQPLSWYLKNLARSFVVVAHLGQEDVPGARLHMAKCALVAGIAVATGRKLLMLGENLSDKPIDYHDLLQSYKNARNAEDTVTKFMTPITEQLRLFHEYESHDIKTAAQPEVDLLRRIDLGDYVAENELSALEDYFVETPHFDRALKAGFHLVVGRKGTGKTAISHMVGTRLRNAASTTVCEIQPNEYELLSLYEFVSSELRGARKSYVLESLWKFMIYSEVTKAVAADIRQKPLFANRSDAAQRLSDFVEDQAKYFDLSFSSRLITTIRDLVDEHVPNGVLEETVPGALHRDYISKHRKLLLDFSSSEQCGIAILIDGLEAGWGLGDDLEVQSDILLSLINAARTVWRECTRGLDGGRDGHSPPDFSIAMFVRSDIFRTLQEKSAEPDKLGPELLSWDDVDALIKVVDQRIYSSLAEYDDSRPLNWADILDPGFTPQFMLEYLSRNLIYRPRDIIFYFQRALARAIQRGSKHLAKRDLDAAMREYSEYVLQALLAESQTVIPDMLELLLEFGEHPPTWTAEEVNHMLQRVGVAQSALPRAVRFLIEANFLGLGVDEHNYRFARSPAEAETMNRQAGRFSQRKDGQKRFRVHNAFHYSLAISD